MIVLFYEIYYTIVYFSCDKKEPRSGEAGIIGPSSYFIFMLFPSTSKFYRTNIKQFDVLYVLRKVLLNCLRVSSRNTLFRNHQIPFLHSEIQSFLRRNVQNFRNRLNERFCNVVVIYNWKQRSKLTNKNFIILPADRSEITISSKNYRHLFHFFTHGRSPFSVEKIYFLY